MANKNCKTKWKTVKPFQMRLGISDCAAELASDCSQIGRQFPFASAAYEATKHALVLIALVFVLHSTKVYGPWHHAKNIYREDTQPLLLLGCEGCGKRLPCVGKLFELS